MAGLIVGIGFAALGAIIAVVVTVLVIIETRREQQHLLEAHTWPKVEGRVVHAAVAPISDDEGINGYAAQLTYTYRVGDQELRSQANTRSFMTSGWMNLQKCQAQAEAEVARYPDNAPVTVFYDPVDLRDALLAPPGSLHSSSRNLMFVVAAGLLLLMIGCAVVAAVFATNGLAR